VPKASLIPAGHEAGARGRAERVRNIAAGASNTGTRECIEMRRGHVLAALKPHVGISVIVTNDNQNVALGGLICTDECRRASKKGND
jgi:hypothetical protein